MLTRICLSMLLGSGLWLLYRVILWIQRIRTFKKTMPIVISLFPKASIFRRFWPKKWQTFHMDWPLQYNRSIYRKLGSDIFALVCLFESDNVFFCDPLATIDIKINQPEQFPKDPRTRALVPISNAALMLVSVVWE
jgi:hypothetical protein